MKRLALPLLLALALAAPAAAAGPPRLAFSPASRIWLEGDSTLHPYKSTATKWDVAATMAAAGPARVVGGEVVIPVRGLKSGEGLLDDNMYRALKAEAQPTIRFAATSCRWRMADDGTIEASAAGQLTVAGVARPATVQATGRKDGDVVRLRGQHVVAMSDHGIAPPVLMGGLIKCADRITVRFDLQAKVTE